ncbi:hypothetical protein MRX96_012522 [Rhipicephalus microplus]
MRTRECVDRGESSSSRLAHNDKDDVHGGGTARHSAHPRRHNRAKRLSSRLALEPLRGRPSISVSEVVVPLRRPSGTRAPLVIPCARFRGNFLLRPD